LKEGRLVDDDTVVEIVKRTVEKGDFADYNGIIWDGVPRTLE